MNRLVRLYPMAWRRRYEAEILELLDQRPLTAGQTVDLVRGAIDAHLHPELASGVPQPWTHRIPGLLATSAGLIWASFWVRAFLAAPNEEWGDGLGIAVLLMFVCLPGDYLLAHGRRIGIGIGTVVSSALLASILPWSVADGLLNLVAGGTAYILVGGGMLNLAAIRAGIGPAARWVVTAASVLLPAAIAIPILAGVGGTGPGAAAPMLVAVLPYGFGWTLIGLRMTLRGAATITDPPDHAIVPEVPAA